MTCSPIKPSPVFSSTITCTEGCVREKSARQSGTTPMFSVGVVPTASWPVSVFLGMFMSAMPLSISASALAAFDKNNSPDAVMVTRRSARSNNCWPSSSSSWLIWCDSVDCVTCTCAAACVKFKRSASARK